MGIVSRTRPNLARRTAQAARGAWRRSERATLAPADAVTGLVGRRAFAERVEAALAESEAAGTSVAVLIADIDGFRAVNEALGTPSADAVLGELARRLDHVVLEADLLARLEGDEFGVLLTGEEAGAATRMARTLRELLAAPLTIDDLELRLGATIGIARGPAHGRDAAELLRHACAALGHARAQHSGLATYTPALDAGQRRRLELAADLHAAIEQDQLVVHYQPQAELCGGRVAAVEALVRWQHPRHGLLGPNEFLPLAERARLMGPLALYVLDRAITDCATWRAAGHDVTVAVNLSSANLLDPDLPADVAALLQLGGLPAGALELELTEDAMLAAGGTPISVARRLRGLGVRLALDDFGTGFSSLAHLRDLDVGTLKIDRSFVRTMDADRQNAAIVRAVATLADGLNLTVVAEGVETPEVWDALDVIGCHLAQGNHIARPMPADELHGWLSAAPAGFAAVEA